MEFRVCLYPGIQLLEYAHHFASNDTSIYFCVKIGLFWLNSGCACTHTRTLGALRVPCHTIWNMYTNAFYLRWHFSYIFFSDALPYKRDSFLYAYKLLLYDKISILLGNIRLQLFILFISILFCHAILYSYTFLQMHVTSSPACTKKIIPYILFSCSLYLTPPNWTFLSPFKPTWFYPCLQFWKTWVELFSLFIYFMLFCHTFLQWFPSLAAWHPWDRIPHWQWTLQGRGATKFRLRVWWAFFIPLFWSTNP